jgi:hypothetical protein
MSIIISPPVPVEHFKSNDTTRNLVIYDEIHMTFSDFVTDHTTSMTNSQISL